MTYFDRLLLKYAGKFVELSPEPEPDYDTPVPGVGPVNATLAVIGESLGWEEVEARQPFVGRSGKKLRYHMSLAGLKPSQCFIDNVMPLFPPCGSMDHVPQPELGRWQEDCRQRVRALPNLKLIVAVGNASLETFTGLRDITRRRGSVYEWEGKKVIAMIHPAAILRGRPEFEKHCRKDWERVKLLTQVEPQRVERTHITPWSGTEVLLKAIEYHQKVSQNPKKIMAIDIETPKIQGRRQIVCVSFAVSPEESLVLPWEGYQGAIQRLCESPCVKVGHNFVSFDRWWLACRGIGIGGELRDTLCMHHCLDPASSHSLEYLTSILTWEPFYKDEGKGHDISVIEKDWPAYFDYCGTDSCVDLEIHNQLWPELERRGLLQFYKDHYEALYDPILDLMLRGVPIDDALRQSTLQDLLAEARSARDRLGELNGSPLFTLSTRRDRAVYDALNSGTDQALEGVCVQYGTEAVEVSLKRIEAKTISGAQLKTLLYDKLGLPLQMQRRANGSETPTADQVALRKLRMAYPDRKDVQEVIDLATSHNKAMKMASFLYPDTLSGDGRFRFTLKLNTEAGRLASAKAPDGTGRNSQNSPRDKRIRRVILPEEGHVLLEADASQIESRIVFVRTKDPELIKLARARSDFGSHEYTASLVFDKPVSEVGKGTEERQAAKIISHAAQRAMQGKTMADYLLKIGMLHRDNTPYEAEECDALLAKYYKVFPGVPLWQARIRREVRATKRLVNRWGRIWDVRYEELSDDLFRKAYNFLPQSECAGLTNSCFVKLWNWLKTEHMSSRIMLQEHDALVCSCALEEVYDVAVFMRTHLEQELDYDGVSLSVPVEFGIGPNYGDKLGLSELPERAVLENTARRCLESGG